MSTFSITPVVVPHTAVPSTTTAGDATSAPAVRPHATSRWRVLLRILSYVLYVGVGIGVWELIVVLGKPPRYILPSVPEVLSYYGAHWSLILSATRSTFVEVVAGFGLGLGGGLAIAILFDLIPFFRRVVWPYLLFLQMIPKIAIAPWMLLIFGFGIESKIVLAAVLAFFPVLVSSLAGLEAVPEQAEELARSMRMSRTGFYRHVKLPGALPQIFSGAKVGITLAVIGAVVGEFIGANAGLGYLILSGQGNADADPIVVGILNLSIVGSLLYGVIDVIERFSISWHTSRRRQSSSPTRSAWRSPSRPLATAETVRGGLDVDS